MSILQIDDLRAQLKEKFPSAHQITPAQISPALPKKEPQDLTEGTLNEWISSSPSSGITLLLKSLITKEQDLPIALIDGQDCFDPASYGNEQCRQLLWIRCAKVQQAIQCTDLLLRDGNLPIVVLDLHLTCERELRQIPQNAWYRFKTQARESGSSLVTLTPRALVPTPHQRWFAQEQFSLHHLELTSPIPHPYQEQDQQTHQTGGPS